VSDRISGQTKLVVDADDLDAARSVAGWLGEMLDPAPLAVTQFEAGPGPRGPAQRVEAYFEGSPDLAAICEGLAGLGKGGLSTPRLQDVPEENWVALAQAALPPVQAGRFIVHGSHDRDRVGRHKNAIVIDAGEAFGTAHHATTQGCIEALDHIGRKHEKRCVLDLGCGSGVLAIAASRLWPNARVLASDIDPVATAVATANMRSNGAVRINVITAKGLAHARLNARNTFDLIIANILAAPLIRLAPAVRSAAKRGGHVVLSGLLTDQAAEVLAVYRAHGFYLVARRDIAGWSALTLSARRV
jgi:ribosomal protein L11 methyltransferase